MIIHSIAAAAHARALCVDATSNEWRPCPVPAAAMLPAEVAVRSAASMCRKHLTPSLLMLHSTRRAVPRSRLRLSASTSRRRNRQPVALAILLEVDGAASHARANVPVRLTTPTSYGFTPSGAREARPFARCANTIAACLLRAEQQELCTCKLGVFLLSARSVLHHCSHVQNASRMYQC